MKTHRIVAIAGNDNQLPSLIAFGMSIAKQMNGSHSATKDFTSYIDAQLYLVDIAKRLMQDFGQDYDRINTYGILTIGNVTARIESIEYEDNEHVKTCSAVGIYL